MKAWIIPADYRRCRSYDCIGYDKRNAKVELHPDGTIDITCRECGKRRTEQARSWKEKRPCVQCGYVRNVIVQLLFENREEHHEPRCDLCKIENSAANHEATARKLRLQATQIKIRRARSG